jgi:hypothetical protein
MLLKHSRFASNHVSYYIPNDSWQQMFEREFEAFAIIASVFTSKMVLRPGFEPGSSARKAGILNRAIFGRAVYALLPEPCCGALCKICFHSNKPYPFLLSLNAFVFAFGRCCRRYIFWQRNQRLLQSNVFVLRVLSCSLYV